MSTDGGARPDLIAKRLGYIAAVLCGLLILATVALTLWGLSIPAGDSSDGMFVSMAFVVMLPGASIPVAIFCLVGTMLSKKALRTTSGTEARTALWLCAGGPVAVVSCYVACFWILTAWGN
jgi:hypothetical protein